MDKEKQKLVKKILFIASFAFTLLTIMAPLLSLVSDKFKLGQKYGPISILIWVIVWITILRLSRNYQIKGAQNRLLTFLVIASSIAFTAFVLYCFK